MKARLALHQSKAGQGKRLMFEDWQRVLVSIQRKLKLETAGLQAEKCCFACALKPSRSNRDTGCHLDYKETMSISDLR